MNVKSLIRKGILALMFALSLSFVSMDANAWRYWYHWNRHCWNGRCVQNYHYRECTWRGCYHHWYRHVWYR